MSVLPSNQSTDILFVWHIFIKNEDVEYDEYTISVANSSPYQVAMALNNYNYIGPNTTSPLRPVFYLNSDVAYISGSGTISDPIRIQ